ncbi:glycosyltransferase family 4 protein [Acuticoccus sp. I52.16.1]|uniref:glycosyltransferase family 4 protein n=1 Tax=Acuticoccus sp. I52.16.1 TaxID=2928472 RepID=UPI001FD3C964|nr:glycosyltransferase family 4 protein [Acuticoccus sp. I52.16.1]UOM36758.1 glycosyltransferase family 4 protein [Acuticoccus sp. I52.16.1]
MTEREKSGTAAEPLRVVFCWSDISGYMAACWRALSARSDVAVKVLAYGSSNATSFAHETMAGIDWHALEPGEHENIGQIATLVAAHRPNVIVVPGWMNPTYKALAERAEFARMRFIMTMDTPWRGDLRQRLARFALQRYLRRMDRVVVTGERSFQYAVRLGVPEARIARGLYGVDCEELGRVAERRSEGPWPRRFLFAGRYAEEKALDVLVEAYRLYRAGAAEPFELVTCGQGELVQLLEGVEGISDHGFRQPSEMRDELAAAGCFVMASRFDPWPLALVEACAAGLPVVAASACGSAVENVRDHVNGFIVATGDAEALARALLAIDATYARLPEFGVASRNFAAAYSAEVWVRRWVEILGTNPKWECEA